MMRIITGSAKGIKLKTLEGDATRPTAERVKEAVFSMLQMDIDDRDVLDLFSGSGQMALEALSRGAKHAVLIDKSPMAINVIKENAQKTNLISLCDIRKEDFVEYIKKNSGRKFDIVFIDPPYASGFYQSALELLLKHQMLKDTSTVVCESGDVNLFADKSKLDEYYSIVKQVRYGRSYITLLNPTYKE